ncbi:hypothetical protein RFM41_13680 [Mesorhizobium sp. VK25A]|uniref:DUF1127 domain-containing protein n=1 Tax=Mesorhizobium vachelliae TaxID=3072309 RepID=A0ABU5A4T9_9HYPH|nr:MULTISPECIES: hypothetical protein [unclassified Mesorhizobium]MDX8532701.1 hypothetical protein [Mesorhizobium sp. VK25D]MDX8544793.1 hypothetical protein [Mesorhizobium sp. VK25A]
MTAMRSLVNRHVATIYVAMQKERTRAAAREANYMDRGLFFVIGDFFNTFGSAARAIEASRKPRRSELKKLGIDPVAFDRIGRF